MLGTLMTSCLRRGAGFWFSVGILPEVLLAASPALAQPNQRTLATTPLRIPYGQSQFDFDLHQSTALGLLQVGWQVSPTCPGFTATVSVRDDTTGDFLPATLVGNAWQSPLAAASLVRATFDQTAAAYADCQVFLWDVGTATTPYPDPGPSNPNPPPVTTQPGSYGALAGVLHVQPGMVGPLATKLLATFFADALTLDVPAACGQRTVTQANVHYTGFTIPTTIQPGQPVRLTLPRVTLFDSLDVSLAGGAGAACDISIYVGNRAMRIATES